MTFPSFDTTETLEQFRAAAAARGIKLPSKIQADGRLHRCDTDDGGRDDAAYLLYLDGVPAGGFHNWKDDLGWQNWRADIGRPLTAAEKKAADDCAKAARKAFEQEKARWQKLAAKRTAELIRAAVPANDDHPYLVDKRVRAHGLRQHEGKLVMPLRDEAGAIWSHQTIDANGGKRFSCGGRKQGCFFQIGEINPSGEVLIAEGYATAASIHEATGSAVIVALDSGSLHPVGDALRKKHPNAILVFCADSDAWTAGNPGENKAIAAARALGGKVAVPIFSKPRLEGQTDFNDLAVLEGLEAVVKGIAAA